MPPPMKRCLISGKSKDQNIQDLASYLCSCSNPQMLFLPEIGLEVTIFCEEK